MNHQSLAERITAALALDIPPVALTFTDQAPEGVAEVEQAMPSACSFWRVAESGVFYASAAAHLNCPIGAMTMGFEMPAETMAELQGVVTMMCEAGYIDAEEPARIPTTGRAAAGIVYGPLAEIPVAPDLVLLWLTPRQAMIYNEAAGSARWNADGPMLVSGRPACAALPSALAHDRPALSFGCAGMRTFTGIREDRMLAAVPGDRVAEIADALERTGASNRTMQAFYDQRKAQFSR